MTKLTVNLTEQGGGPKKTLGVSIELKNGALFVKPDGYVDYCSANGDGSPVILELYEGKLRVVVWEDIDPVARVFLIGLEKAKESNRKVD